MWKDVSIRLLDQCPYEAVVGWVPMTWTYVLTRQRRPDGVTVGAVTISSGLGTNDMDSRPYEAEAASWDYY